LPHTMRTNKLPDAAKTAVLFRSSMPANPTIATVAVTRIDSRPRADVGRLRIIHGARMT